MHLPEPTQETAIVILAGQRRLDFLRPTPHRVGSWKALAQHGKDPNRNGKNAAVENQGIAQDLRVGKLRVVCGIFQETPEIHGFVPRQR